VFGVGVGLTALPRVGKAGITHRQEGVNRIMSPNIIDFENGMHEFYEICCDGDIEEPLLWFSSSEEMDKNLKSIPIKTKGKYLEHCSHYIKIMEFRPLGQFMQASIRRKSTNMQSPIMYVGEAKKSCPFATMW
jgi:hypothetical protein